MVRRFIPGAGALGLAWVAIAAGCGGGGGGGSTVKSTMLSFSPNSIVYGAPASSSTYSVTEMSSAGTNPVVVASSVPNSIPLFAANPAVASQFALVADPTGSGVYGIYLSSSLSLTGATALVAPAYSFVGSITVTENGKYVVYSAATTATGISYLYVAPVAGGTPVRYGISDGSTVSPVDSDTVAFVGPVGSGGSLGNDQVFTQSIAAGPSGAVTQLTTDSSNHLLPAFNPTGTELAFWEESGAADTLVVDTLATSTLTPLANPLGVLAQGEAFSEDGTTLVIAGDLNGAGNILIQPADGSSGPTSILSSSSLLGNYGVFWTDANGRSAGGPGGLASFGRRPVHRFGTTPALR